MVMADKCQILVQVAYLDYSYTQGAHFRIGLNSWKQVAS